MPASNETLQYMHQMARTAGLRLREPDLDALAHWSAERWRKLALPGIEQYAQLLAQDSAVGRQERELLTVRCTTGESYFFRDPAQLDLIAATLLPELIVRCSWRCFMYASAQTAPHAKGKLSVAIKVLRSGRYGGP